MRKIIFISSIAILFMLNSCVLTIPQAVVKKTFDPDLPPEQSAKVLFWLNIVEYNGLNVHKEWGSKKGRIPLITLPPGKASFMFNAYIESLNIDYSVRNCEFSYNFEAGKEYTVSYDTKRKPGYLEEYFYYVKVYEKIPAIKQYSKLAFTEKDLLASFLIFDTQEIKAKIKEEKKTKAK